MLLELRKNNSYVQVGLLLAVLAGLMISFYEFSAILLFLAVFAVLFSFKRFDLALLALIFYLPFQMALNVTGGVDLASGRVAILFLFAVWVLKSLAERKFAIRLSLQTILILVFFTIASFSTLYAWEDERALRKILVFVSIFPLYFLVSSIADKKFTARVVKTVTAGALLLALIGIGQFALQFALGVDPLLEFWGKVIAPLFYGETFSSVVLANPSWLVNINGATLMRAFSLFPDPHMFSFYLSFVIPILLSYLFVMDFKDKKYPFVLAVFIVLLAAELLTFSRGGYLGMVFGIMAVIALGWKHMKFKKKMVLGAISSLFLVALFTTNQSFLNRFTSSFDFQEGSNSERIKNWQQGLEMFDDNFWLGVGIGNYSYNIEPSADYRVPIYAHNLYLDIGAEMGIFALLAWLSLIFVTLYQLGKYFSRIADNRRKVLPLGLIGSLVWFSVHGLFDTPIWSPVVLAMLMIALALAAVTVQEKKSDQNVK